MTSRGLSVQKYEMKDDTIHILCCTDDGYAMQYGVMLTSLFETNPDLSFHIWLLSFGMSKENESRFQNFIQRYNSVNINIIYANASDYQFCPLHKGEKYTRTGYLPLFASQLLPESIEKILYLDGDLLINCNIDELWNTDINNKALAAVIDLDSEIQQKRLKTTSTYFNSGVLLLNLVFAKEHDLTSKYVGRLLYLDTHRDEFVLHDQDVFNYVCDGHTLLLPIKFNLQMPLLLNDYESFQINKNEILRIIHNNSFILHFCYKTFKPWDTHYINPPYTKLWRSYLKKSDWKDCRRTSISKKTITCFLLRCLCFLHLKHRPKLFITDTMKFK